MQHLQVGCPGFWPKLAMNPPPRGTHRLFTRQLVPSGRRPGTSWVTPHTRRTRKYPRCRHHGQVQSACAGCDPSYASRALNHCEPLRTKRAAWVNHRGFRDSQDLRCFSHARPLCQDRRGCCFTEYAETNTESKKMKKQTDVLNKRTR